MSAAGSKYWENFWANKNDPLHSASTDTYYDRLASELRLLLPQTFTSILDVGCGNGILYQRMGLDTKSYVGIDLSERMIATFKGLFPRADVHVGDMRQLPGGSKFDVIFSHGVIQYISPAEFGVMLAQSKELLTPSGQIIHAGVLWDRGRSIVESGVLQDHPLPLSKRMGNAILTRSGLKQGMGYWYSMRRVRQQAAELGMNTQFYGSLLYPYRFHAVFTRREMK
jgi:cyclopropane fatty-acyl-phospholipid synthase-like methyltransferase